MTTICEKLKGLTNEQLIQISNELRLTTVSDDALIRTVIKDTVFDTVVPVQAFIGVNCELVSIFADRLIIAEKTIQQLEGTIDRRDRHPSDL